MKKWLLITLSVSLLTGCNAGTTADLMTFDNIIAAANESKKGVNAFNVAVIADAVRQRENMLQAVGKGIKNLGTQSEALSPEEASILAKSVVATLRTHLDNYTEQERRRAHLFNVTIDNLNYIIQISEQGKKFSIYRSDISAQWKDYLESSSLKALGKIVE